MAITEKEIRRILKRGSIEYGKKPLIVINLKRKIPELKAWILAEFDAYIGKEKP